MSQSGDRRTPSTSLLLVIAAAIAVEGLVAARIGYAAFAFQTALLALAGGWVIAGCGLVAWRASPSGRTGPLLIAAGAASFIGAFGGIAWEPGAALAVRSTWLSLALVGHAVLIHPNGRAADWAAGVLYLAALVMAPTNDPLPITIAMLLVLAVRWRRHRADRAGWSAEVAGVLVIIGAVAGSAVIDALLPDLALNVVALRLAAVASAAMVLAMDTVRLATERARLTDVVLRLDPGAPGSITSELRRATGDPSLEVAYPVAGDRGYVDATGGRVTLPGSGDRRTVTVIGSTPGAGAIIIHDGRLETEAVLEAATLRAVDLAAANARLQGELREQLREVRASRRRIVEAGDAERRALERRLAIGLLPTLVDLRRLLGEMGSGADPDDGVARAQRELTAVEEELGRLADGVHPRALEGGGLCDAIDILVRRSPVPVALSASALPALPPAIGATAFFACGEALTNVAKHARATRVAVTVAILDGRLSLEVVDDGRGGARPEAGSGLIGVRDRVEAVGGSLRIHSPVGAGTRVSVVLPVAAA